MIIILSLFTAFIITFVAIPTIVTVANKKNLYDEPNIRNVHKTRIPTLGGFAIFAGVTLSFTLFWEASGIYEMSYIIAGIIILFIIGLKDDVLVIAPKWKLLGQIFVALIVIVLADIRITGFHGFVGINDIGYIPSILFTIFIIVVIMNGFNLIDGIDGLASGIGILTSITFGMMFYLEYQNQYTLLAAGLTGSLIAFFYFNVFSKKQKIFMGDTGSLILGFLQAIMAIQILEFELSSSTALHFGSTPALAIGILCIPMFDTLRVFCIRIIRGRSPFSCDKQHIHHKLIDLGLSHIQSTGILLIANIFFIILVFTLQRLGVIRLILLMLVLASILSTIPVLLVRQKRKKEPESFPN